MLWHPASRLAYVCAEEHKALVEGRSVESGVVGKTVQGGLVLIWVTAYLALSQMWLACLSIPDQTGPCRYTESLRRPTEHCDYCARGGSAI